MNYDTIRCSGRSYFTGPATFNSKATCFDKLYIQNKTARQDETYIYKNPSGSIDFIIGGTSSFYLDGYSATSNGMHYIYGGLSFSVNNYFPETGEAMYTGMHMHNSDIIGCNVIAFNDTCESTEGLLFPKTGIIDSYTITDYWALNADGAGNLKFNNRTIANSAGTTFNAEYKADLAETMPKKNKDETIPVGYIVRSDNDEYVLSDKAYDPRVTGVVSDTYGHCLNGVPTDSDVAVALAGRVPVYLKGTIEEGECIVASEIPGVGMKMEQFIPGTIIGKAIESKTTEEVGLVKMLVFIS